MKEDFLSLVDLMLGILITQLDLFALSTKETVIHQTNV